MTYENNSDYQPVNVTEIHKAASNEYDVAIAKENTKGMLIGGLILGGIFGGFMLFLKSLTPNDSTSTEAFKTVTDAKEGN